ncbi:hypothetical protein AXE85_04150 [Gemella sp. oral taxon 928]|nr:hypothetical protein AXE85_04150 [Gemella sp. oral taxon 928]
MKKVRVYEYAKEIGKQSKELINILKEANIEVSNHMSMLTQEGLEKLDSIFKKKIDTKKQNKKENKPQKKNNKQKILTSK